MLTLHGSDYVTDSPVKRIACRELQVIAFDNLA